MTYQWWLLSPARLNKFAAEIANFHVPAGKNPCSDELKHRAGHEASILATAADLKSLQTCSPIDKRRSLVSAIFMRPYARRAAVMIAAYQNPRHTQPLCVKVIKERANLCGHMHNLAEPIQHIPAKKPDGTPRDMWSFGPVRYAQQVLISWLLDALRIPQYYQFSYSNRGGINAAAKEIGSALSRDYRFWITTDIKLAYPSITKEHFRKVFPEVGNRLERYVVFPVLPYKKETPAIDAPRRELPQGAAHSSLVLSAVIDGCLADLSLGEAVVVVYADNIAIGAHTKAEAECAFFAIQQAFAKSPSGLELHQTFLCDGFQNASDEPLTFVDGFRFVNSVDFCGYRISKDLLSSEIKIRPAAKAWKKFWSAFEEKYFSEHWTMEELQANALERVSNWRSGLPLWVPNESAIEMVRVNAMERFGDRLLKPYGEIIPHQ